MLTSIDHLIDHNEKQAKYLRELTRDSPSSAIVSFSVAMSIASFKCSARCSGLINFVVSTNCANGLCATEEKRDFYEGIS